MMIKTTISSEKTRHSCANFENPITTQITTAALSLNQTTAGTIDANKFLSGAVRGRSGTYADRSRSIVVGSLRTVQRSEPEPRTGSRPVLNLDEPARSLRSFIQGRQVGGVACKKAEGVEEKQPIKRVLADGSAYA
jgi:hypothetical protein